ncbi:hypothetical protein DdX_17938 [Ditylenchus destructor]|uniref:Uncharacterized protein n=1 Tax=Ditylenchus destructor TaxID=166010 RepID=A0AAD4QYJ7_9BILA|nr:hypothetical protein DdX_17938 [Ditylenchus destructor]
MNKTADSTNKSLSIGTIVSKSNHVIIIVSCILAIGLFSHTLYLSIIRAGAGLRVKTLSKCMVSYMAFNTVTSALAIPRYTFSLFGIAPPVWAGLFEQVHLAVEPLTVFFLALDRCLTVQFMSRAKTETIVFICNMICNFACILSIFSPNVLAYFLQIPSGSTHVISKILANKFLYIFSLKMVVGVLNVCACAFLCWKVCGLKTKQIGNTIVIVSCVTDLFLEFIPNLTSVVITLLGYTYIFSYTGPYSTTTQCVNVMRDTTIGTGLAGNIGISGNPFGNRLPAILKILDMVKFRANSRNLRTCPRR